MVSTEGYDDVSDEGSGAGADETADDRAEKSSGKSPQTNASGKPDQSEAFPEFAVFIAAAGVMKVVFFWFVIHDWFPLC